MATCWVLNADVLMYTSSARHAPGWKFRKITPTIGRWRWWPIGKLLRCSNELLKPWGSTRSSSKRFRFMLTVRQGGAPVLWRKRWDLWRCSNYQNGVVSSNWPGVIPCLTFDPHCIPIRKEAERNGFISKSGVPYVRLLTVVHCTIGFEVAPKRPFTCEDAPFFDRNSCRCVEPPVPWSLTLGRSRTTGTEKRSKTSWLYTTDNWFSASARRKLRLCGVLAWGLIAESGILRLRVQGFKVPQQILICRRKMLLTKYQMPGHWGRRVWGPTNLSHLNHPMLRVPQFWAIPNCNSPST